MVDDAAAGSWIFRWRNCCHLILLYIFYLQITQGNRLDLAVPSGNIPDAELSDVATFDSVDQMTSKLNKELEDQSKNSIVTVTLTCDVLNQKQLKTDICKTSIHQTKTKNNGKIVSISTNDCILSLIHQAYIETRPENVDVICSGSELVEVLVIEN